MKISIIIPAYNEAKYIQNCLKSLGKQSLLPQEVIIVDDGSTDATMKILASLRIENLKVKTISQTHLGAGAARNLGASHAEGNVLVFVDSDMEFDQDFLKKLTQPIAAGQAKGTFSKDEFVKNWDNPWAKSWNYLIGITAERSIPQNYPDTSPVFRAILKSEFKHAGGFDTTRGYDDDWSLSERLGYKATAAPDAVYYHYNPDSFWEIFRQAKWRAKRKYKGGIIGKLATLLFKTHSDVWFWNFWKHHPAPPKFFWASVAYYNGLQIGILQSLFTKKVSK